MNIVTSKECCYVHMTVCLFALCVYLCANDNLIITIFVYPMCGYPPISCLKNAEVYSTSKMKPSIIAECSIQVSVEPNMYTPVMRV